MSDLPPVSLEDIRAAARRIAPAAYRTPLVRLPIDGEVYAKCENLQRTGSFKLRGAYNYLASLPDEVRRRGVVTHSSGNHAQGVACAARLFGVSATIVIPEGAPEIKIERTRAYGARIVRCDNTSDARRDTAEALATELGATLVPPFDHPWIIAGQGSVGLEIVEDLPAVENVLVPVGGGGLISGIATVLAELQPGARVIGVEPDLAADAKESFEAGALRRWSAAQTTRTVADGVRTQSLGELNFEIIRTHVTGFASAPEAAILEAARWYALQGRLVVEPTGALTLAAYRGLCSAEAGGSLYSDGPTVLVISGGNVAPELLSALIGGERRSGDEER